jgi:hypothetical protein
MLLVALRLDRTVFAAVDQLGTGRLEHVAGDVVDLCREFVELGAVPGWPPRPSSAPAAWSASFAAGSRAQRDPP